MEVHERCAVINQSRFHSVRIFQCKSIHFAAVLRRSKKFLSNGYHKRVWEVAETGEASVTLFLEAPDGDMGFPGNKRMTMTYSLSDDNALQLKYHGTSDKNTVINMTNLMPVGLISLLIYMAVVSPSRLELVAIMTS